MIILFITNLEDGNKTQINFAAGMREGGTPSFRWESKLWTKEDDTLEN